MGKIRCLLLRRDTLEWIIAEAAALMGGWNNAAFLADNLFVIDFAAILAVGAVSVYFFAKQHEKHLLLSFIIHHECALFQRKFLVPTGCTMQEEKKWQVRLSTVQNT